MAASQPVYFSKRESEEGDSVEVGITDFAHTAAQETWAAKICFNGDYSSLRLWRPLIRS